MGIVRDIVEDAAEKIADAERSAPPDPWRWTKRGIALVILIVGWVFILWTNRFHLTAPTIFVCIGFLAIELAVYNLFRTGAEAVAEDEERDDSTWGRPMGARTELEREKKALLKAIKECEFDREMGKLSKADADEMIGVYRARAIEVIKELDKLGGGAGTVREQIEREVKARLELEEKANKAAADGKAAAAKDKAEKKKKGKDKKAPAKAAADAAGAAEKAAGAAEKAPTKEPGAEAAADAAADDANRAAVEAKDAAAEAKDAANEAEDDAAELAANADSTTAPVKEATP